MRSRKNCDFSPLPLSARADDVFVPVFRGKKSTRVFKRQSEIVTVNSAEGNVTAIYAAAVRCLAREKVSTTRHKYVLIFVGHEWN